MGCNTSQELKTKEGSSTGVNGTTTGAGDQNEENATSEQNCNNEDAQQHKRDSAQEASKPSTADSHNTTMTQHSKTSSINSNGDASNVKHFINSNTKSTLPSPAKENGALPQTTSCNKAEITEFNDMDDMGEDEGE